MADRNSTRKTCSVEGCCNISQARGYCKTHWSRWRKHGDPLKGEGYKLPDKCEVEGCCRDARSRWNYSIAVCAMHYLRMLQRGTFDDPVVPVGSPDGKCIVDGCSCNVRSTNSEYCEMHYGRIRRNGSIKTLVDTDHYDSCQYCGKITGGSKYCSARCTTRASRSVPTHKQCDICGNEYSLDGKRIDSLCCSDECQREMARRNYASKMKSDPLFVLKVRSNEYKRKARKKNAFLEEVDRDYVMARDKWTCHLCKEKIPKNAAWPDRLFGTLDHIIPLAKGGKHSYANIKAAHLTCNCSKNDKIIGQIGLEFAA